MSESRSNPNAGKGRVILGAAAITVLLFLNVYLLSRVEALQSAVEDERAAAAMKIAEVEERSAAREAAREREVKALRRDLEQASRIASSHARREAKRQSDRVSQWAADAQRRGQDVVLGELSGVKKAAESNRSSISRLDSDVADVRELSNETRKNLHEAEGVVTRAQEELEGLDRRVNGNGVEIAELRRMGEREMSRFELAKSRERTRFGDVSLRLRDVNDGKNRYSIEILADDRVMIQKNRSVNESIEFYAGDMTRPYQLVVTELGRDQVKGYLIRPKFARVALN